MESLSVAGNIFLGQTEAPLLIKAYLEKMNKSEILLVMIGGMATVAGAVLAAYIGFLGGDDPELQLVFAKHLLDRRYCVRQAIRIRRPRSKRFHSPRQVR